MSYRTHKQYGGSNRSGSSSGGSGVTTVAYNLTSSDTINLTGLSGELIINVSSLNATETLNRFTNHTSVTKITLRPADPLQISVNDKNVSGDPSIRLFAPTEEVLGIGLGFIIFEKRAGVFFQTNYIDQYNS